MKIKTRKDALLHCFDIWLWLAITGSKYKADWPGWLSNGGYLVHCHCYCPACQLTNNVCENCIINWTGSNCFSFESPYIKWMDATTKQERTKWALRIAALALDAL